MSRTKETFGKKDVRNKQLKKRKEKEKRRQEKKEQGKKSNFNDMIAWVDENGQICSEPPDLSKKEDIDAKSIEIGIPKNKSREKNNFFQGKIKTFDESKGFGFIECAQFKESIFVHVNDCNDEIKKGDVVEFETDKGMKGIKAINVKRI